MTEHGDLDVLVVWGRTDSKKLEQPSNEEEGDRIVHVDDRGRFKKPLVRARIVCLLPSPRQQAGPSVKHVHIYRLADGLVTEHWAVRDDYGMFKQLGITE